MTQTKPKIGVILSTHRDSRWGMQPAEWILEQIAADGRMEADLIDLAAVDLPFFDEPASNRWMPSQDPKAVAWQETLAGYDGFVFVLAEYNHSVPAVLKNALDQAWNEWNRKPAAIMGYGSMGAARSGEHLRGIAIELRMVNVADAVHLGGADFFKAHPMGAGEGIKAVEENMLPSAKSMIGELYWWAELLKDARAKKIPEAA